MEPRCVGSFVLEEQIGRGGMGVVYRARCQKSGRVVALKLLPNDVDPAYLKRFQREMEVLRSLRHPHIVQCYDGLCDNRQHYYAMEYVEHGTLANLLLRRIQLNWDEAVDYALQICSALDYVHKRGIVHRDLKPGNLLLGADGRLKLSDFGVAWLVDGQHLTREGRTVGSFAYMSPEQISGSEKLTASSDLYALGCVLFEMIAGQRVFGEKLGPAVLMDHLRTVPPNVRRFAPDCPIQLANLIAQLLEKSPARRPKDANAVLRALMDVRRAPEFVQLSETEVTPIVRTPPTLADHVVQLGRELTVMWQELPVRCRKWIAVGGLIVLGITIGLGFRSNASESPHASQRAPIEDPAGGAQRTLRDPPAESGRGPSMVLFLLTMTVLGGLAAYLHKLNREEEEHARMDPPNVVPRQPRTLQERHNAWHYLDGLRSLIHFH